MTPRKHQTTSIEELLVELSPKEAERFVGGFHSINKTGGIIPAYDLTTCSSKKNKA
ncbi:hypothetical protein [Acaryochloris sp. IP29b_bin.148]|uniref:hypothetical protein n=1 Tax=Acaryochloris sp. IP29b_bin.148 TaxID=2969218 RepID=UPI00260508D7|nr:hypothetical protein [Acaryochloris sp. IP29b_bin.148]